MNTKVIKIIIIILLLFITSLSISRAQNLQEELKIWDLPVEIEKSDEGYKIIDSESTNFTEATFSISYLMTSLEYVVGYSDIEPNFQIEYVFVDDDGEMWQLHISRIWLNNYLNCNSKRVKEDMIRNLIMPHTEEQRVQQNQIIEERIQSLR